MGNEQDSFEANLNLYAKIKNEPLRCKLFLHWGITFFLIPFINVKKVELTRLTLSSDGRMESFPLFKQSIFDATSDFVRNRFYNRFIHIYVCVHPLLECKVRIGAHESHLLNRVQCCLSSFYITNMQFLSKISKQ